MLQAEKKKRLNTAREIQQNYELSIQTISSFCKEKKYKSILFCTDMRTFNNEAYTTANKRATAIAAPNQRRQTTLTRFNFSKTSGRFHQSKLKVRAP